MSAAVPVVDISDLSGTSWQRRSIAAALDAACREHGFFSVIGHGVALSLVDRLETQARAFFAQSDAAKAEIAMPLGGRAWRGWFPVGGELTSGRADQKEGLYFGAELPVSDQRVMHGLPLHGPNLFPSHPPELRATVLEYIGTMRVLGMRIMGGLALGLGLDQNWFARALMRDPIVLFRLFHYPEQPSTGGGVESDEWGVREHTDYGFLTILHQDAIGGLQVRSSSGWLDVAPVPGAFVCNLGDMLELVTAGRYRSTPHRVRLPTTSDRLSAPFFLDPSWDAVMYSIPAIDRRTGVADEDERWDGASPLAYEGTYGDYLLGKVSKVFPALRDDVL
jgi:isopenicillin N synthase-like dioxygenase